MSNEQSIDWSELWSEVRAQNPVPVTHRLYYDDQGYPLFYSMEDLPGNYIEITAEQFRESNSHVRVTNGKIVKQAKRLIKKLVETPETDGTLCANESVAVVVQSLPGRYWKLKSYESD